jgi:1-acyl-sn-glycerol-3-phosphate acyltransferase
MLHLVAARACAAFARLMAAGYVCERVSGVLQGAFSVAAKAKVPVVPITLVGTGEMMPSGKENCLYSGSAKVTVHKPIPPGNADDMMLEARKLIAADLPKNMVLPQT